MPWGDVLQTCQGQSVGVFAEAVAVGAGAQHQVEQALGAGARLERLEKLCRLAPRQPGPRRPDLTLHRFGGDEVVDRVDIRRRALTGDDPGQTQEVAPFVGQRRVRRQHRRGVVGDVADRQLVEGDVVVGAPQRGRSREDDVGVTGGLIDVDVEADHEVE